MFTPTAGDPIRHRLASPPPARSRWTVPAYSTGVIAPRDLNRCPERRREVLFPGGNERGLLIQQAIARLEDASDRELLHQVFVEGVSLRGIAARRGITPGE